MKPLAAMQTHRFRLQDVETRTPVILTTSQLLTTGLDAPTCHNIVLVRLVNSMVEFKQIIGRGTRVRDEYGRVKHAEVLTPEEPEDVEGRLGDATGPPLPSDGRGAGGEGNGVRSRKYYFDGGQVEIVAELVHELDADGKQLRVVKLTDYTAEKVRSLFARPEDLRACWANAGQRADIIHQLAERGIDFQRVAAQAGQPDAHPFDLLCHLAFNAPILPAANVPTA
jgi:type I restriction enzyme, R subunit